MCYRVIFVGLLAASLSAQNVKVNWDRSTFFSSYKTYQWIPSPSSTTTNPQIAETIVSQTNLQLEAKGVKKATAGQPDILVAYQTTVDRPMLPSSGETPSAYQPGPAWNGKHSEPLPTGTLAINLYDARSKALVWRALITAEVGESRPSDKVKIAKGLSKAFAQFPPMGKQ